MKLTESLDLALKNIVSQHQANRVVPDKIGPDNKSLGQSVRRRLFRIFEPDAEIGTVAQ